MERIVKIGIIGCGGIANGKHLRAISNIDFLEPVAFCDIIEERAIETAKKFGLSRSKFSLLFPQHTGTTFKRYLTKKRIDYAVTLIRSTELPIGQIAQMAGYSDLSTFYRNFTKVTGTAPSTYRCTQDLEQHLTLSLGYYF